VWGDWAFTGRLGAWQLRPGAGLRYARYARHAWAETGADALSLTAANQIVPSAQADLDLRVARVLGRFAPFASVSYRRELTDGQTGATLQLSGQADARFVVNGLTLARDALTTRAGYTLRADRVGLSLSYESKLASGQVRQALQFGLEF
jgi:uncharacterized protein with beta-barrel porin domain